MLQAGVPMKIAQERLGHSSVTVTMDTYSHVSQNMKSESAEAVERLLGAPRL